MHCMHIAKGSSPQLKNFPVAFIDEYAERCKDIFIQAVFGDGLRKALQ